MAGIQATPQAPRRQASRDVALRGKTLSPQRLQLFRGAKFDLQRVSRSLNGLAAVPVGRNSGWENPFLDRCSTPTAAVERFRRWLMGEMPAEELAGYSGDGRFSDGAWLAGRRLVLLRALPALRGKNVACWCKPRDACHGDVLLKIANSHKQAKRD